MKTIRDILDPFEILYLAVAIATFDHTTWTAAFAFEGAIPKEDPQLSLWYLKGGLIAVAVDVGMLITSRYLGKATDRWNKVTLVSAFVVAAIASFYFQLGFILYHTPDYGLSAGVSQYWAEVMQPIIDARVFILPMLLPLLATIYTLARITNHQHTNTTSTKGSHPIEFSGSQEIIVEQELPLLTERSGYQIDWPGLKLWDPKYSYWRQYQNRDKMEKSIARLEKTRGIKIDGN